MFLIDPEEPLLTVAHPLIFLFHLEFPKAIHPNISVFFINDLPLFLVDPCLLCTDDLKLFVCPASARLCSAAIKLSALLP